MALHLASSTVMPNQRKDTKKHIGLWLEPEEISALKKEAAERKISVADLIRDAIQKYEQKKDVRGPGDNQGIRPD